MKKLVFLAALLLAGMLLLPQPTLASTIGSYDSGFQVQNLDEAQAATVEIIFYNQDGTIEQTLNDVIGAGSSTTYYPLTVSAGFDGSVVISADREIAAIANVIGDTTQGSSYSGFTEGAETVSLPLINKNNFGIDTWFNVQNTDTTSAVDVTVTYSGTTCSETATIQPGAAYRFDQAVNSCLSDGYVGAATVSATGGSIVATVLQVASNGLFAYNGFTSGSPNPVFPLISANVFGFHTGMQIQNQGDSSTSVTVTYRPAPGGGNGTECTETKTISSGASATFTLYAFSLSGSTSSTCNFGEYFVGSAEVTGNTTDQPLVGIVNQTNFVDRGSAYNSFDPGTATAELVMPLIMDAYSIWTGYNVMNVGTNSTVTCSYSGLASSFDDTQTLDTNEAMNVVQLSSGFPANTPGGYVGSATCTATGGGLLLGVVNQAKTGGTGDSTLTYEAFNK